MFEGYCKVFKIIRIIEIRIFLYIEVRIVRMISLLTGNGFRIWSYRVAIHRHRRDHRSDHHRSNYIMRRRRLSPGSPDLAGPFYFFVRMWINLFDVTGGPSKGQARPVRVNERGGVTGWTWASGFLRRPARRSRKCRGRPWNPIPRLARRIVFLTE